MWFNKHLNQGLAVAGVLVAMGAIAACSSGSDDEPDDGFGGSTSSGGASATGGTAAGGAAAGGMSAGGMAAGGMAAGGMEAGGMAAGGMETGGMDMGMAGAPSLSPQFTFDSDDAGFEFGYAHTELDEFGTTEYDAAEGDPAAGSLKLTIPFDAEDQKYAIKKFLDTPVDISGGITVRVKVEGLYPSDFDFSTETTRAGLKVYAKSTEVDGYSNSWLALNETDVDGWITLTFDPTDTTYYAETDFTPSSIIELGIEVTSNDVVAPESATVYVDTFSY